MMALPSLYANVIDPNDLHHVIVSGPVHKTERPRETPVIDFWTKLGEFLFSLFRW